MFDIDCEIIGGIVGLEVNVGKAKNSETQKMSSHFDATDAEVNAALREYFDEADRNKRGTLDQRDIPLLLDRLNIDRSKYQVFLKKFDTNKDGVVSFDEFKVGLHDVVRAHVTAKNEKKLRDAFNSFDKVLKRKVDLS